MKNLNCKNCGADMRIDISAMTAVCHYCGTKYVLSREDTDYFREFYHQMNSFLSLEHDEQERRKKADTLWEKAETEVLECTNGSSIEIRYMHCFHTNDCTIYTARRNIIFCFDKDHADLAEQYRKNVSLLDYPSADTRQLSNFFPKVTGGFSLTNGGTALVTAKDEDEYPLSLFGTLGGRHVAWIISRMENLCCVLEYNGLVHLELNENTLYINPYTHQASLYGGWWKAGKHNSLSSDGKTILQCRQNLLQLRNTAARLLGFDSAQNVHSSREIPKALAQFISGLPENNAYDDFALWDDMLIKAYGERKFIHLDTDDETIYGGG